MQQGRLACAIAAHDADAVIPEKIVGEIFDDLLVAALEPLKGSVLGKAVTYARNQKPYMENYLLDGRCALSNNAAENAIRPFTVGRKNWLFADTPKGADASAMVYSLVETAKANGINVYAYLQYLLINMADGDWHTEPGVLDMLMPWSEEAKEQCKQ